MSASPIRFRHGLLPLLAYPRGSGLRQSFSIATGYDLSGIDSFRVTIEPKRATGGESWVGSVAASTAFAARVFTLDFADDAASDDDDEVDLASVADAGLCLWAVDALDDADGLLWRLQGEIRFAAATGADGGTSAAIGADVEIAIDSGAEIAITILGDSASASVDNAAVIAALEEDLDASKEALGIDALEASVEEKADAAAVTLALAGKSDTGHTHGQLHDAATVSGNGIQISGQQISLKIGTGSDQIAAGNDSRIVAGGTAVQPNTSPVFSSITVNGGGNVAAFTGNVAGSIFSVNPHIAIGYPSGTYHSFSAYGQLSWTNGGFDFTAPRDAGLGRDSAGRLEVNDGVTRGQFRDLILRDLIATQYIRPASYTVSAANALSSPPEGAAIYVSNETGGACWAFRRSTSWLRMKDDAPIS